MNNILKSLLFVFVAFMSLPSFASEIKLNAIKTDFKTETNNAVIKQKNEINLQYLKPKKETQYIDTQKFENKLSYNFLDTDVVPIKLSIVETISTKNNLQEGQKVKFIVAEKVVYNNNLILHKGDIVEATVENIVTTGMNGFPAEIVLDHFKFPNIKSTQLLDTVVETGTNRCFWVYPLKWALTPIPLAGSLTNFIMGGHAKIEPKDTIIIHYYPNWK